MKFIWCEGSGEKRFHHFVMVHPSCVGPKWICLNEFMMDVKSICYRVEDPAGQSPSARRGVKESTQTVDADLHRGRTCRRKKRKMGPASTRVVFVLLLSLQWGESVRTDLTAEGSFFFVESYGGRFSDVQMCDKETKKYLSCCLFLSLTYSFQSNLFCIDAQMSLFIEKCKNDTTHV